LSKSSVALNRERVRARIAAIDREVELRLREIQDLEQLGPYNILVFFVDDRKWRGSQDMIRELRLLLDHYRSEHNRLRRRLGRLDAHFSAFGAVGRGLAGAREAINGMVKDLSSGKGVDPDGLDKAEAKVEKIILDHYLPLLKKEPTSAMICETMRALAKSSSINGSGLDDGEKPKIVKALQNAARANFAAADFDFRRLPSIRNLQRMLAAEVMINTLDAGEIPSPRGWVGAQTTHILVAGDTLAALSLHYYKAAKYWDVIYRANVAVIGSQPEKLPFGKQIGIP